MARGIAISMPVERMVAHRGAEMECYRLSNGAPCRPVTETRDRCLAVATGVRANGMVITADPRTCTVSHDGSGADRPAAEGRAMRDCAMRPSPGMTCRIAAVRFQN